MKLFVVVVFFMGGNALAVDSACNLNGTTMKHGSKGCSEGFQVECNNGTVIFSSDNLGNGIPCAGMHVGAAKKGLKVEKHK